MSKKLIFFTLVIWSIFFSSAYSDQLKEINIIGNERISNETIKMFSDIKINQSINDIDLNNVLKNLYETNFFEDVSVELKNNKLIIKIVEAPIIEDITYDGIKANKIRDAVLANLSLKPRSSYNEFLLSEDKKKMITALKDFGYFYAKIETYITDLDNNKINIKHLFELGEKAKIKKITFVGNKIYKNRKLRSLIVSEEYKFWKFISGKKFLNENLINFDQRLLKNFYLNKGYYNIEINSSFAKMIDDNEFEIVFNINPNKRVFFNDLSIDIPEDYNENNYLKVQELLDKIKGKPYSISTVEKILEQIEVITINDEFMSVKAFVKENLTDSKLDIVFKIEETEKYFVKKINIFGNNITQENVIRNQFEIDEGDPFNDILQKKSENNLKNLNFFRSVKSEVITDEEDKSKEINITVEEKPTGEVFAGAGAGTQGGTISFGIKENNYLGRGLSLKVDGTLTEESFKGQFNITNPNYKNSDKSIFLNIQAIETDRLTNFGYKTNKTGFDIGTGFEYLDDLNLSLSARMFYERITTDSTASARQRSQEGDYLDTFVKLNFDYDKRNQKFKTTEGFRSVYGIDVPFISDTNTIKNSYFFKHFSELYEDNISTFSLLLKSANSLSGDDVKLSERLYIPSSRLRGFERGKVGPKDGDDFIGGNYITAFNAATTLPQILPNLQEVDVSLFFDAANIWGVDYDSSINDGSDIRSSIGVGIDWFTPIGPMNFSFTEAITKSDTDIKEFFRFNIGTSF